MKTLYILKGLDSNLIKIGVTGNIETRTKEICYKEKEEIEVLFTYHTEHYKLIESCVKWYFRLANVPRESKREWFNIEVEFIVNFIEKTLKAIEAEPLHTIRWMTRYIKDCRQNTTNHNRRTLWFID